MLELKSTQPILEAAKRMTNKLREQIVILRDRSDGKLYASSAIKWLNNDRKIEQSFTSICCSTD